MKNDVFAHIFRSFEDSKVFFGTLNKRKNLKIFPALGATKFVSPGYGPVHIAFLDKFEFISCTINLEDKLKTPKPGLMIDGLSTRVSLALCNKSTEGSMKFELLQKIWKFVRQMLVKKVLRLFCISRRRLRFVMRQVDQNLDYI
uniref:Uncharacterized protein n=1 Tax=Romanomermis culicivorax TaxID=13658 RepID=A0A915IKV7_ROMCU